MGKEVGVQTEKQRQERSPQAQEQRLADRKIEMRIAPARHRTKDGWQNESIGDLLNLQDSRITVNFEPNTVRVGAVNAALDGEAVTSAFKNRRVNLNEWAHRITRNHVTQSDPETRQGVKWLIFRSHTGPKETIANSS